MSNYLRQINEADELIAQANSLLSEAMFSSIDAGTIGYGNSINLDFLDIICHNGASRDKIKTIKKELLELKNNS